MNVRPLLVPTLVLLLTHSLGAEDILLRHHWQAGKVYYFDINLDMEVSAPAVPAAGQTAALILQTEVTVRQETGAETKHAELKITTVKALIDAAGELMTYDSADPAMSEPRLKEQFGRFMGQSLTLVYDKDDTFKDVIIPEGFSTPFANRDGPGGGEIAALFREIVEGGLPGKALAMGGTFAEERKIPFAETTILKKTQGRLDSIVDHETRRHAKVVTEGTFEVIEEESSPVARFKGETLFDSDRKAVSRRTLRIDIRIPGPGVAMSTKLAAVATLKSITDLAPAKK